MQWTITQQELNNGLRVMSNVTLRALNYGNYMVYSLLWVMQGFEINNVVLKSYRVLDFFLSFFLRILSFWTIGQFSKFRIPFKGPVCTRAALFGGPKIGARIRELQWAASEVSKDSFIGLTCNRKDLSFSGAIYRSHNREP